jgi:hypothetical protein
MTDTWTFEATTTVPGWLEIPALDRADHPAWVDDRLAQLRDAWDADRWDDEVEAWSRAALASALDERGADDALVLQVWTMQAPIAPTVALRRARVGTMPDWGSMGYRVLPYDAAAELGPGIEATFTRDVELPDGERTRFVHAVHVFDVDDALIVCEVDPTPAAVHAQLSPGLAGVLGSLVVTRPDGSRAIATLPAIPEYADDAHWHIGPGEARADG